MSVWYCGVEYFPNPKIVEDPLFENEFTRMMARAAYVGDWRQLSKDHQTDLMKMAKNSLRKQIAKQRPDRGILGSILSPQGRQD